MKTFAEKNDKSSIDWNAVLDTWWEMDEEERIHYLSRSRNWVTCACGNLCASIPRDYRGAPLDMELEILGDQFAEELTESDIESAKETLAAIEQRSAALLAN